MAAVALSAFAAAVLTAYFGSPQRLLARAAAFYNFAEAHVWLLAGLYVVRLAFLLPASLVIFITGMICGPALGELIAVAGLTLGGSIEFLLVRSASGRVRRRYPSRLLERWQSWINRSPFHAIMLLRVAFVPFDMVNFSAALAGAPLRAFAAATALGVAPTSLPMVIAGASVNFRAWAASGRLLPEHGVIDWRYVAVSAVLALLIAANARRRKAALALPVRD